MRTLPVFGILLVLAAAGIACTEESHSPAAIELGSEGPLLSPPAHAQANRPDAKNFVAPLDWRVEVPPVEVPTNATGLTRFQR
jgi:hypothetical protein